MTRRWAPPTRYTLRRNTASIIKNLIWFWGVFTENDTWNLWLSEVESRTQGSRPRTQKKSEAKDSFFEDRHSRGQGQKCSRPRTQAHAFSKKKSSKIFFSGNLQFIGVPRIFDWGRPKAQITWNDIIKIFPNRNFLWDKDIVEWKIWNRCLCCT